MEEQAYKQYMSEVSNWLHSGRRLLLDACLNMTIQSPGTRPTPLRILEVGAGSGKNIQTLSSFGLVDAIEVEPLGITSLSENPNVKQLFTSKVPFPLDQKYDVICAMDFLEHVEDDKEVFDWIDEHLNEGGVLFVTVPAYQFLFSSHDVALNHFRRYRLNQLVRLNENKLTLTKKGYFNCVLFPIVAASRILERLLPKMDANQKKQSSSVNPFLNKFFFSILKTEIKLIRKYPLFPYGLTAFALFKKMHSVIRVSD